MRSVKHQGAAPAVVLAALAMLGIPCAGGPTETRAPDTAPVALRKPAPMTPEETAGSGVAAEVAVRVDLDDRGRVTAVDIVRIDPSTEFDDHFARAAVDTLMEWRFAPARLDGQPVSTTLQWSIRFPSLEEPREEMDAGLGGPPSANLLLGGSRGALLEWRWRIVALPPGPRLRMQAKLAKQAERFIDADHRQQAETSLFRVVTDATREGAPESVAGNLEAVFWVLNEMLKGSVPAQPTHGVIQVYMFAHEAPFRSFADSSRAYEWAAGFYSPTGVIAFHMQAPTNEHLREIMLHEAVHAFIDRFIVRPGGRVPVWLDEGLADYIGNSEVRKRKLVPGKHRRNQIYHAPGMATIGRSISQLGAMEVKKAMKNGEALSLADLVAAERDEFYGDQYRMFYTESWMLVHFLRHGRESWADDEFPRFVLYVAEGYPAADAFVTVYGATAAEMQEEFRRYVMSF